MPHSNPSRTSVTSSFSRRSEAMVLSVTTTPSRSSRALALRRIEPLRTIQPAMMPALDERKISRISAWPRVTSPRRSASACPSAPPRSRRSRRRSPSSSGCPRPRESASSEALPCGRTLKPTMTASEAAASETLVSVIAPTPRSITRRLTSSPTSILDSASSRASTEPAPSPLRMSRSSCVSPFSSCSNSWSRVLRRVLGCLRRHPQPRCPPARRSDVPSGRRRPPGSCRQHPERPSGRAPAPGTMAVPRSTLSP